MLQCYNRGCGQKYDAKQNTDTACQYHPGTPVFHDALKGWSCCSKRSTDFTEFLNFKGCTFGPHSNIEPPKPEKPSKDDVETNNEIENVQPPKQRNPRPCLDRPSSDEPMQRLKVTVGASLRSLLDKLKLEQTSSESAPEVSALLGVPVGTSCQNKGCKCSYQGPQTNEEACHYHSGVPIFHEGMKYWSCCQRKTSEFDSFLNQEGCTTGKHCWTKSKEQVAEEAKCKVDWHQTGPIVCISVFTKGSDPELSFFEANKVVLKAHIVFNKGSSIFDQTFILRDAICPEKSEVKLLGSKVEINLYKAEPFSWATLELPPEKPTPNANNQSLCS